MRFAPIGPPKLLQGIKRTYSEGVLGKYHLNLAHDVVQNAELWENLLPEGSVVIVDNSIIELGLPVVPEIMKEAHDILGDRTRRVIVLPDRFDDYETTVLGSQDYFNGLTKWLPKRTEYMWVLQGRTPEEISEAIDLAEKHLPIDEGVNWVGIPRRLQSNMGTRMHAVLKTREWKMTKHPRLHIHLLGFSDNIQDDILCAKEYDVEGIDSAVPLRLGQQQEMIDVTFEGDQAGPRGKFWEDEGPVCQMTVKNIGIMRRAITSNSRLFLKHQRTPDVILKYKPRLS